MTKRTLPGYSQQSNMLFFLLLKIDTSIKSQNWYSFKIEKMLPLSDFLIMRKTHSANLLESKKYSLLSLERSK
jgi:hypothetical protein